MSGFRLKLNRLKNAPFTSSVLGSTALEEFFEADYCYEGQWTYIIVKPVVIDSVVIFLIHYPEGERESMALVYNTKDTWSDIEKESTGLTAAIGASIERHYSSIPQRLAEGLRDWPGEGLLDDIMWN